MGFTRTAALATVSNALLAAIVDGLPLPPAQVQALLQRTGLAPPRLRQVDGRTSILDLARLWDEALRASGDPFLGLHIGRAIPAERFGLAVHAAQHGADLRQVLQRLARYAGLVNELIRCELAEAQGTACFTMRFQWDVADLERHAVDIAFATLRGWAQRQLGPAFRLRELRLRHRLPGAAARYAEVFEAPLVLAAPHNALVFDAALLGLPVAAGDPGLGAILDHYASAELAGIPVLSDLPGRVSQLLARELRRGAAVSLGRVCGELGLPARQLQRGLGACSTSFSALLDQARRSLAPALLLEPGANVERVAFHLGYSEPTAFIRVFKKWYAMTPGDTGARPRAEGCRPRPNNLARRVEPAAAAGA